MAIQGFIFGPSELRQLLSQPKFLIGEALLIVAFVTSWLWLRVRAKKLADTYRIRQREQSIHVSAALKVMSSAVARGDTVAFFLAARSALQRLEHLTAEASQQPMQAVIGDAVDLIIFIERTPRGRRVTEILHVSRFAGGQYQVEAYAEDARDAA